MLSDTKHELLFTTRMNVYYHEGMERLYGRILNGTACVSIVASSGAFFALTDMLPAGVSKDLVIGIIAFIVVALNAIVLSFGIQDKLRVHADFKRQWSDLVHKAYVIDEETGRGIGSLQKLIAELNAKEPPPIKKRLHEAYEMTCQAMGLEPHRNDQTAS